MQNNMTDVIKEFHSVIGFKGKILYKYANFSPVNSG